MNSPRKLARVAGVLYLLITVAAIVAHMYVPSQVIVPGDAAATAANLTASGPLFRFGAIGGELLQLVIDHAVQQQLVHLRDGCRARGSGRNVTIDAQEEWTGAGAQVAQEDRALAHHCHDPLHHCAVRQPGG